MTSPYLTKPDVSEVEARNITETTAKLPPRFCVLKAVNSHLEPLGPVIEIFAAYEPAGEKADKLEEQFGGEAFEVYRLVSRHEKESVSKTRWAE